MLGGLLVRVVIEIISVVKFRHIRYSDHIAQSTAAALAFYQFRRRVHGPVTVSILTMYVIGFYLLTPEFSQYIPLKWMIMMHVSFLIIAAVLFWLISKGIRKEISTLKHLANLQQAVTTENEESDL
jgi:large-conductance mechanosensitive channel